MDLTGHWVGFVALLVFGLAYLLVIVEEFTHLRKSKPVILAAGESFTIYLQTDFAEPGRIAGAVVYVNGAKQYVEVAEPYDAANARVRLAGRLREGDIARRVSAAVRDLEAAVAMQYAELADSA